MSKFYTRTTSLSVKERTFSTCHVCGTFAPALAQRTHKTSYSIVTFCRRQLLSRRLGEDFSPVASSAVCERQCWSRSVTSECRSRRETFFLFSFFPVFPWPGLYPGVGGGGGGGDGWGLWQYFIDHTKLPPSIAILDLWIELGGDPKCWIPWSSSWQALFGGIGPPPPPILPGLTGNLFNQTEQNTWFSTLYLNAESASIILFLPSKCTRTQKITSLPTNFVLTDINFFFFQGVQESPVLLQDPGCFQGHQDYAGLRNERHVAHSSPALVGRSGLHEEDPDQVEGKDGAQGHSGERQGMKINARAESLRKGERRVAQPLAQCSYTRWDFILNAILWLCDHVQIFPLYQGLEPWSRSLK